MVVPDQPVDQQPVVEYDELPADRLLDRPLALGRLSGETLAWAVVLLIAAVMRLASLGTEALNPAEARQAFAAYDLFKGSGLQLDSTVGGPLAVVLGSLSYFLFGISDEIARCGPALAGLGAVALLIWLRPYLGRLGALLAALLLAISPTVVYFSRQALPDAYAIFFALVLLIALLRLVDQPTTSSLLQAAGAAALLFAAAPVGLTILVPLLFGALFVPGAAIAAGNARDDAPSAATAPAVRNTSQGRLVEVLRAGGLSALAVTVVVLLLVFSAVGTIPRNLLAGLGEWCRAWFISLVGPAGTIPGRSGTFTLSLLLVYEPLAFVLGIWSLLRLIRKAPVTATNVYGGRLVRGLLTGWALLGAVVVLIGGALQPWLLLLVVVPLTLLAGATGADLLAELDWQGADGWQKVALGLAGCAALALLAWCSVIGQILQPSRFPDQGGRMLNLLLTAIVFAVPLTIAAGWFALRLPRATALLTLALGLFVFLGGYGLRSAVGLNFYRSNAANEPLVYAASTPEIRPLMRQILNLSRDLTAVNRTLADPTGGHGLTVALDPAVQWPIQWYLRDFPGLMVVSPGELVAGTARLPAAPQLVFRISNDQPLIAGQKAEQYNLLWSYPAGMPLTGETNPLLRMLGFLVFRSNVPSAGVVPLTVEYGPDVASRLFLPDAPAGPFNLTDRPGAGKSQGQFDSPRGVAVGPDGSLYVVDMRNARVERFAADGRFIAAFGSLGHGDGQFWRESSRGPTGIAVGPDGSVYVADTWNYRIQKFTADGQFVTKWGTYINLVTGNQAGDRSGLYGPRGIAIGANGDLLVTDTGNGRVVVYGPNGEFRREFGTKGNAPGQLDEPVGIVATPDGSRIYVADSNNARIAIFDGQGKAVAQWAVEQWRGKSYFEPYLALDSTGTLYATSSITHEVLKFTADGQIAARFGSGVTGNEPLGAPYGIAMTTDGSIYVSDGQKSVVTKLNTVGAR